MNIGHPKGSAEFQPCGTCFAMSSMEVLRYGRRHNWEYSVSIERQFHFQQNICKAIRDSLSFMVALGLLFNFGWCSCGHMPQGSSKAVELLLGRSG